MTALPRYAVGDTRPKSLIERLLQWETFLALVLVLVIAVSTALSPYFLDVDNLSDATQNFSEKAIVALAMAFLILIREIDLSVSATIALSSLVMGALAAAGWGPAGLIAAGLATGALCGAVNGAIVAGLQIPSIVVTIGTMSLYRGIAIYALGDQAMTAYPSAFTDLGQTPVVAWPPVYLGFLLFIVLACVAGVVLARTTWGRMMYAMGNNPSTAVFSGVPVARIRFLLFVGSGLAAGLASVLLTARVGSTRPNIAAGWELDIVTMAVLGGISIAGGSGTILGVTLAAFVLGLATFSMSLLNLPGVVINIVIGAALIAVIALPILVRRFSAGRTVVSRRSAA